MLEAPHSTKLCKFLRDLFKFIKNLLFLFFFLENYELIEFSNLFRNPALDFGTGTFDISDQLDIFLKEFFLVSEYVFDLEFLSR